MALLGSETLVFKNEPSLYSESMKLNHRLTDKYAPVRKNYSTIKKVIDSLVSTIKTICQGGNVMIQTLR